MDVKQEKVDFPAVTFCKRYPFHDSYIHFLEHVKSLELEGKASTERVKQWVLNNTVPPEEMFEFFHHATEQRQFPCDTKFQNGIVKLWK